MTLKEIQKRLSALKEKGYVPTKRRGPTGIGHTLEQELNLTETNIAIPDIGGRVELKANRRDASSLITLFTFNRGVWQVPQKEVIENYGYIDKDGRKALFNTIYVGKQSSQGLTLILDKKNHQVKLTQKKTKRTIAV